VEAERPVNFDGRGSTTPNPPIVSYEWNFGNGETGSGATVTFSYRKRRNPPARVDYTVTLRITDSAGGTATCSTTCTVTELY
jgi:PKD repeat protein